MVTHETWERSGRDLDKKIGLVFLQSVEPNIGAKGSYTTNGMSIVESVCKATEWILFFASNLSIFFSNLFPFLSSFNFDDLTVESSDFKLVIVSWQLFSHEFKLYVSFSLVLIDFFSVLTSNSDLVVSSTHFFGC